MRIVISKYFANCRNERKETVKDIFFYSSGRKFDFNFLKVALRNEICKINYIHILEFV